MNKKRNFFKKSAFSAHLATSSSELWALLTAALGWVPRVSARLCPLSPRLPRPGCLLRSARSACMSPLLGQV